MKKYTVAVLILAMMACTSKTDSGAEIKAIEAMVFASRDAWNRGDIKGYMDAYLNDSNTQFITKRGRYVGWHTTLKSYEKNYPNKAAMGTLSFDLDSVELLEPASAGLGHVTGRWQLIRASDTPNGYFSLITRKTPQGHKIVIDHTW